MSTSRATGGKPRSGRRKGTPQTREAITQVARTQFAEKGYDRTTIRSIAAAADVDPALVVHYFGSKDSLFVEVMSLPAEVVSALAAVGEGDRARIGHRLAEGVVAAMERPETKAIVIGRIRAASSEPAAIELVRETVEQTLAPLAGALTDDQPERRAALVASHVVGLVFARHVVKVAPLVAMTEQELVAALGPTFQRYLVEPLS